jgi:Predicted xylanase/chitin deacetylase
MKNLFKLFAVSAAVLSILSSCKQNSVKEPVFVEDEYGVVNYVNPDEKCVYLVFTAHFSTNDNGYFENFDGIEPVLNTLAEKGVKGSFFPTGNCFREEKYKASIQRIIDEGHYLSAHSNHHLLLCSEEDRNLTLVSPDSLKADIAGMEAELEAFGLEKSQFCWMIPPYEYYNKETADGLKNLGYKLCNPTAGLETSLDWMGPDDAGYTSAATLLQNIWDFDEANTLNGTIILVHAMNYPCRTDEDRLYTHLGEIIDTLRERGYSFGTFKELL